MSDQIYWLLEVTILPGQLENFRAVANDLIASAQAEPGTLAYQWNLTADETACHIYERYRDSAAVLVHSEGFGKIAERFLSACKPVRFDVYGSPSEEVKEGLAGFHPNYHTSLGGFSRG